MLLKLVDDDNFKTSETAKITLTMDDDYKEKYENLLREHISLKGEHKVLQGRYELSKKEQEAIEEKHARLSADLVNFKARIQREINTSIDKSTMKTVKDFLQLVDTIEFAISHDPSLLENEQGPFYVLYNQSVKILSDMHVEEIDDAGRKFNPKFNEPISFVSVPGKERGEILRVMRKGYKYKGDVIRQSLVEITE